MSGSFIIYLLGYVLVIAGVAYGMRAAGIALEWVIAVVLVMGGLGLIYAFSRAQRDRRVESRP